MYTVQYLCGNDSISVYRLLASLWFLYSVSTKPGNKAFSEK